MKKTASPHRSPVTAPLRLFRSPHVTVAQYSQEDPTATGNQILVHCQTSTEVTAEQGVVETLHVTKAMFGAVAVSRLLACWVLSFPCTSFFTLGPCVLIWMLVSLQDEMEVALQRFDGANAERERRNKK